MASVHPSSIARVMKHERARYDEFMGRITDPMILSNPEGYVSLFMLGFPMYVLSKEGKVYKLSDFGTIAKELSQSKRGVKKHLSVTMKSRDPEDKPAQYFVHILLAWAFLPREDTTTSRVGFKDGNNLNVTLDNLVWE